MSGGKGGNLESLGNTAFPTLARSGGNWRKPVVLSGPRFDPLLQRAGVVNFWGSETMISAFP